MPGFKRPTTTPAPDELFDHWLTRLSGPQIRVLLYIIRRTLGFRKNADTISLQQFLSGITTREGRVLDAGTGIRNRTTLTTALSGLADVGLIEKERRSSAVQGDMTTLYRLLFADEETTPPGRGFRRPTTTPVPDDLYDYWLPQLTDPELKALLYIVRRTLGFRKNADTISLRQFIEGVRTQDGRVLDEGCGIQHRKTLGLALDGLEGKGLIQSERRSSPERGDLTTLYVLIFEGDAPFVVAVDPRSLPPDLSTGPREAAKMEPVYRWSTRAEPGGVQPLNPAGTAPEPEGVHVLNPGGTRAEPEGVQATDTGSTAGQPAPRAGDVLPVGYATHSQQTELQQTVEHDTDSQQTEAQETVEIEVSKDISGREGHDVHLGGHAQLRMDAGYQALVQPIIDLGRELGDEAAPRASISRAYNLMREADVAPDAFLELLSEAKALTRSHQAGISKLRADSAVLPRKNLMPYFFATLESLLFPERHAQRQAPVRPRPVRLRPLARRRAAPLPQGRPAPAQSPQLEQETHPIWRAVLDELRLVLTQENFDTWLAATRVVGEEGKVLRVAVSKPFHKDWLEQRLYGRIAGVMERLGYADVRVEFVVRP